jgi:hypothetical protein
MARGMAQARKRVARDMAAGREDSRNAGMTDPYPYIHPAPPTLPAAVYFFAEYTRDRFL